MSAAAPSADSSLPAAPWRAGLFAARANFVPGLFLWAIASLVLAGYYWHAPTHALLEQLTALRERTGLLVPIVGTALCGGVIPFLYLKFHPASRAEYTWASGAFFLVFWAYKGIEANYWYVFVAWLFGDASGAHIVILKMLLDQLVYSPFWAVPLTVLCFSWHKAGFRFAPLVRDLRAGGWYRREILPSLIANFGLWVPIISIVYCLPLPLQLPLFDLVLVFYMLLMAHILRRQ